MEWVETTGRSIDEAKDAALDQLGVDESEAEFEVLEEPRTGLFGRVRGEARIRARVKPARPRPKVERRERGRGRDRKPRNGGASKSSGSVKAEDDAEPAAPSGGGRASEGTGTAARGSTPARSSKRGSGTRDEGGARKPATASTTSATAGTDAGDQGGNGMAEGDVTVEEQAELTTTFLTGLVEAFGVQGDIDQVRIDEDTIELHVNGEDLGLLIGPKGQTLQAVQELSRTYVQRKAAGTHHGRVRIDIGGYRQRRREALERFTAQVAAQVKESGGQKALEPMNASDRKVVHDTANTIDGVRTISEGEEPRRRVVIVPD